MKYTKGKWKIYKSNDNVSERLPPEGRSCLWSIWVVDEDDKAIAQIHRNDDGELKTNAQLIAASPIGFELAKAVIDADFDDYDDFLELKEIAEKFMDKCNGI